MIGAWIYLAYLTTGVLACILQGLKSADLHFIIFSWSIIETAYILFLHFKQKENRGVIIFYDEDRKEGVVGPTIVLLGMPIFIGLVMFARYMMETGKF